MKFNSIIAKKFGTVYIFICCELDIDAKYFAFLKDKKLTCVATTR